MSDRSSTQTTDPVDISVIVAARRRGVSLRVLAAQSCCSAQAVSSRIKNYERRTGEQIVVHAPPPLRFVNSAVKRHGDRRTLLPGSARCDAITLGPTPR